MGVFFPHLEMLKKFDSGGTDMNCNTEDLHFLKDRQLERRVDFKARDSAPERVALKAV